MIHFSKSKIKQNLLVLLAIVLGVAIFYGNTLKNDFVFDNHQTIEQNIYLRSLSNIPKMITSAPFLYYRPLLSLSDLFTYQISPQPWAFHLANLIYFTIDIFLVFTLAKLLTKNFLIGLFAGLIFLIHPINTEAVNWISVPDLLSAVFILLTTIYYFLYRSRQKSNYLIFVYIFYGLGIFSKEPAMFTPLIFMTLDLASFRQKISDLLQWKNLKPYLVCAIILLANIGVRFWALGGVGGAAGTTHNLTGPQQVFALFYSFTMYVGKVFWPFPLSFLYSSPFSYKFLSLNFLLAILVMSGYVGLCLFVWKKRWPNVFLGLVWFFVFLFPSMVFINSLIVTFAERYLFVPTIGFSIIIAMFLGWLWKKGTGARIITVLFLGAVFLASFLTIYQRNTYWKSDVNIYLDTLKKDPNSDTIRYDLAVAYLDKGNVVNAKKIFNQIIKLGRGDSLGKTYNNLGDVYRKEGNFNEALKNYQASIKADPLHKEAYNNLGAMSVEKGYLLESLPYLCKAIQIDPNFKNANTNFDYAASRIQGLDNKSFMALYDQILKGDVFKPASTKDLITPKTKDCSLQQGCLLTFDSQLPKNEFLFPFMIVGLTPSNEVVRIRYSAFNPQTSEITLGVDHKFGNSPIHLYFPACGGVYYEAEVQ